MNLEKRPIVEEGKRGMKLKSRLNKYGEVE